MTIYFAPMEGVTDVIYRRTHAACFGGIDKYFIPFVSPTQHLVLTPKEKRSVSPQENVGCHAVPQILTKYADQFLWAAQEMADRGYQEVNLNLGCPSGTVTGKGKGAGMLRDLASLEPFLDDIFARSPLPVSIKTRIGFHAPEEWEEIWALLSRYPASEFIIHPRTRVQFYKGIPFKETYAHACKSQHPALVYNGDLFTPEDCTNLMADYPQTKALMIGRGLLVNPALAQQAKGGPGITREVLRDFHDRLYHAYRTQDPKNVALYRMRVIMNHMACCFVEPKKILKAIRKAPNDEAYLQAVTRLFDEYELCDSPSYLGPEELNY